MAVTFSKLGIAGRMGNQIFQCAAAIGLALRNNDHFIFPHWEYEKDFNLHNCYSDNITYKNQYNEPYFHYSPIPYQPDLNIEGFYQSALYWQDCQDFILSAFTPKVGFGIKYNVTSIHVRRGDYINNNAYQQLNMDYYTKAMQMIGSKEYYVFSEDITWCKQHFKGSNITFIDDINPVNSLSLMASCSNNIIANSTFSWWGAWLNKLPNKIVIAPSKWFGPALSHHNTKDILPKEWIQI